MATEIPWEQRYCSFIENGCRYFVFHPSWNRIDGYAFSDLPAELQRARRKGEVEYCEKMSRDCEKIVLRQKAISQ